MVRSLPDLDSIIDILMMDGFCLFLHGRAKVTDIQPA